MISAGPSDRFKRVDHQLEPWEKRCHALADVLDYHKIINTEEKRRGVEALGSEMISKLSLLPAMDCHLCKHPFRQGDSHTRGIGLEDG